MKINKAAMAYGIVTFCISISCAVCAKYLPEPGCFVAVGMLAGFGALLSTASIDLMSELK